MSKRMNKGIKIEFFPVCKFIKHTHLRKTEGRCQIFFFNGQGKNSFMWSAFDPGHKRSWHPSEREHTAPLPENNQHLLDVKFPPLAALMDCVLRRRPWGISPSLAGHVRRTVCYCELILKDPGLSSH